MDYEKAYKSLVAKIKNAHLFAQTDSTKNVLEDILPELAESEDERIRKDIIAFLQSMNSHCEPAQDWDLRNRWLPYLEKHKTSEEAIRYVKENHSPDEVSDFQAAMNIEEDELMRNAVISTLERFEGRGTTEMQISWLKSLRPQTHWKPSEEQMRALKKMFYGKPTGSAELNSLESLYNDLTKL
jgi:hypothetical protein